MAISALKPCTSQILIPKEIGMIDWLEMGIGFLLVLL